MAKGKWCVEAATLGGKKVWRACRKRDVSLMATEDNLERAGTWCTDRGAVESLCEYLNAKAEEEESEP